MFIFISQSDFILPKLLELELCEPPYEGLF